MSDDRQVTVRFPEKMTVDAPKTDQSIDALKTVFVSFSKMLEKATTEVVSSLQVLRKLPELVTLFQQTVTAQFSTLFE